jgi:hypothetical protein
MRVTRTPTLPKGSRALASAPRLAPHVDPATALQRLRHHAGRALTRQALDGEQRYRDAHVALAGRRPSAGVVAGLRISASEETDGSLLILGPGRGLAASGHDVVVRSELVVAVDDLAVVPEGADEGPPRGVGVLLLQPVVVERRKPEDPADRERAFRDPCPIDPGALAFDEFQLLDGARLAFHAWPSDWPDMADPAEAGQRRNLLAYQIYRREAEGGPQALPWTAHGIALALVAIDAEDRVALLDRAAVVRRGGVPPRIQVDATQGTPSLWQARLEGLMAQAAELAQAGWDGRDAAATFRHLPPVGILPRIAWDSEAFFPDTWRQAHAPVPLEQLDLLLEASAGLAPFDLSQPDTVKWLVPVPQAVFDPKLLQNDSIDPAFEKQRRALLQGVAIERARQRELREMADIAVALVDVTRVPAFDDEDALPFEARMASPPAGQVPPVTFWDIKAKDAYERLMSKARLDALSEQERAQLVPSRPEFEGLQPFAARLSRRVDAADDAVNLGFIRLQTDIYRLRQIMLTNEEATKLATSPVLATIAKGETSYAINEAIQSYFATTRRILRDTPAFAAAEQAVSAPLATAPQVARMLSPSAALLASSALTTAPLTATLVARPVVEPVIARPVDFGAILATSRDVKLATAVPQVNKGIGLKVAIAGEAKDFRTTTVADRLAVSAATEAKSFAVKTKADIVAGVQALEINKAGLTAPVGPAYVAVLTAAQLNQLMGSVANIADGPAIINARTLQLSGSGADALFRVDLGPLTSTELARLRAVLPRPDAPSPIAAMRVAMDNALAAAGGTAHRRQLDDPTLPGLILAGAFDPDPVDGDEAAFFSVAVATLESAVGILRVVEGRIEALRAVVEHCQSTLDTLGEIVDGWQSELATVDRDLAERRHDVRVADALIAEERARIDAVNARRREIRDQHVRFVAYARPRTVSLHSRTAVPTRPLAGVLADPVPACLLDDVEPPEALAEMLAVLRDVPLAWLPAMRSLIARLDRPALLDKVYVQVKLRAQLKLAAEAPAQPGERIDAGAPRTLTAVTRLLGAYREVGRNFQRARLNLDLASQAKLGWEERRRRAEQELSLNDLIESGGRPDLVRRASQELEQIERVASCLWQRFGEVPAATRLAWSQVLSAFDEAQDLSRLDRLAGWRQLDFALARELASLVVSLFGRVDPEVGEARTLISDLVRVCLLLASHAPVDEIVAGHLEQDAAGKVGDLIDLAIDRGKPRIGMRVAVYRNDRVMLQGVVQDLAGQAARVKVVHAEAPTFRLDRLAKARLFADPRKLAARL